MKLSAKAQRALDKVVDQFKTGDLSPVVEIARLHRSEPVPFDLWSFSNRIMAYIQTGSTDLRGYRQWQKAGRHVTKGAHAAFILAPRIKKQENDDGEEEPRLIGFLAVPVFPYHATDGEPLPETDFTPRKFPPLADVAQALGISTTWRPLPPDRLGDCNLAGTRINIGAHDPAPFFHELAHAIHARLDGGLKKNRETQNETVADFTACVLMQLYDLGDRTGNTWDYISHYHKDPLVAIQKALAKVEQVLQFLEEVTTDGRDNN